MSEQEQQDLRDQTRTRLERAAVQLAARREVASRLSTGDMSLAERVEALGFGSDTASVFDLLPVIHVAWADGEVQRPERQAILRVLEARGIDRGSEAYLLIDTLLERHPGKVYIDESLAVLREIVAHNNRRAEALVDLCFVIAQAHGAGLLGLRDPIDAREKQALHEVAEALGERATLWLKAKFGELSKPA
ncbi:MAG: TerB family tellurite resistance protein [Myxococcales bacterium]|nr:TerB family tellurite resistance protein [Myxococcales bacterium]